MLTVCLFHSRLSFGHSSFSFPCTPSLSLSALLLLEGVRENGCSSLSDCLQQGVCRLLGRSGDMRAACLTQTTKGEGRLRGRRDKRGGNKKERVSKAVKDREKKCRLQLWTKIIFKCFANIYFLLQHFCWCDVVFIHQTNKQINVDE